MNRLILPSQIQQIHSISIVLSLSFYNISLSSNVILNGTILLYSSSNNNNNNNFIFQSESPFIISLSPLSLVTDSTSVTISSSSYYTISNIPYVLTVTSSSPSWNYLSFDPSSNFQISLQMFSIYYSNNNVNNNIAPLSLSLIDGDGNNFIMNDVLWWMETSPFLYRNHTFNVSSSSSSSSYSSSSSSSTGSSSSSKSSSSKSSSSKSSSSSSKSSSSSISSSSTGSSSSSSSVSSSSSSTSSSSSSSASSSSSSSSSSYTNTSILLSSVQFELSGLSNTNSTTEDEINHEISVSSGLSLSQFYTVFTVISGPTGSGSSIIQHSNTNTDSNIQPQMISHVSPTYTLLVVVYLFPDSTHSSSYYANILKNSLISSSTSSSSIYPLFHSNLNTNAISDGQPEYFCSVNGGVYTPCTTSPPPNNNNNNNNNSSGLSKGIIIVIAVVASIGVIILLGLSIYCYKRKVPSGPKVRHSDSDGAGDQHHDKNHNSNSEHTEDDETYINSPIQEINKGDGKGDNSGNTTNVNDPIVFHWSKGQRRFIKKDEQEKQPNQQNEDGDRDGDQKEQQDNEEAITFKYVDQNENENNGNINKEEENETYIQ